MRPGRTSIGPSKWTITIDNGDNAPLVPDSVRLEMVKRNLCFEASVGKYTLYYGDHRLGAPRYDLGQFLVVHVKDAAQAAAGTASSLTRNIRPGPTTALSRSGTRCCCGWHWRLWLSCWAASRCAPQKRPGLSRVEALLVVNSVHADNRNYRVTREALIQDVEIGHQFPRRVFA